MNCALDLFDELPEPTGRAMALHWKTRAAIVEMKRRLDEARAMLAAAVCQTCGQPVPR